MMKTDNINQMVFSIQEIDLFAIFWCPYKYCMIFSTLEKFDSMRVSGLCGRCGRGGHFGIKSNLFTWWAKCPPYKPEEEDGRRDTGELGC